MGDFGSSQVVAARSGGRAGGRASSSSSYRSSSSYSSRPSSTRVVERTTVIQQPTYVAPTPTVIVSPGYSYNPMGGFGLGYGLGAINSIGNAMQDARQEAEISQSRAELQNAKMKEMELEARLRQLEMQQVA